MRLGDAASATLDSVWRVVLAPQYILPRSAPPPPFGGSVLAASTRGWSARRFHRYRLMKKLKFRSLCVVTTSLVGLLVSGSCTEPTTQLPGEVHAPTEHFTLTWLNEPIDFAYVSEDPFQTP